LAEAVLEGKQDPAASVEDLEERGGALRECRRLREALDQALPEAEEELRQTIFENQAVWKSQADRVLEECIEGEKAAYEQAREIAEKARRRRQLAEAVAAWIRKPAPSFSTPSDATIASTVQQTWVADLSRCERQMDERQRNEQRAAQSEFEEERTRLVAGGGGG
jgi:hypothetical protein